MKQDYRDEGIRLNRYLSEAGVCSRREADRRIEAGRVKINGEAAETGRRVFAGEIVTVDGKKVEPLKKRILLLVNKPPGVIVTSEVRPGTVNIDQFLHYPKRVFPVGRLDKDSQGLLLMTNDGDIVNRILRAGNAHEKEYRVTVDRPVTKEFLTRMENGIAILDTVTLPAKVKQDGKRTFTIILTQGLNRQIRRMCEACGYRVEKLVRIRLMNLRLGDLKIGEHRLVTEKEEKELMRLLSESVNSPAYMQHTV